VLWYCWLGSRTGVRPVKNGGWWRWALLNPDGVAPIWMVGVSASVNLPLHHKVQMFSSGTGSPEWSRKKGRKTVVVWWWCNVNLNYWSTTEQIHAKTKACVTASTIFKDCIFCIKFYGSQSVNAFHEQSPTRSIWTGWSAETKCWHVSRHDITFRNSNNLNFTTGTTQHSC